MPEDEENAPGEQSLEEKRSSRSSVFNQSWDCNVLENAERAIFPTKLSDDRKNGIGRGILLFYMVFFCSGFALE